MLTVSGPSTDGTDEGWIGGVAGITTNDDTDDDDDDGGVCIAGDTGS